MEKMQIIESLSLNFHLLFNNKICFKSEENATQ